MVEEIVRYYSDDNIRVSDVDKFKNTINDYGAYSNEMVDIIISYSNLIKSNSKKYHEYIRYFPNTINGDSIFTSVAGTFDIKFSLEQLSSSFIWGINTNIYDLYSVYLYILSKNLISKEDIEKIVNLYKYIKNSRTPITHEKVIIVQYIKRWLINKGYKI